MLGLFLDDSDQSEWTFVPCEPTDPYQVSSSTSLICITGMSGVHCSLTIGGFWFDSQSEGGTFFVNFTCSRSVFVGFLWPLSKIMHLGRLQILSLPLIESVKGNAVCVPRHGPMNCPGCIPCLPVSAGLQQTHAINGKCHRH